MKSIIELARILNETLGWNKARMDCFAKMLFAFAIYLRRWEID